MAREMGSKKGVAFAIIFQNVFAYCITLMIYQLGGLAVGQVAFGAGTIAAIVVLVVFLYLLFRPDPTAKKVKAEATTKATLA